MLAFEAFPWYSDGVEDGAAGGPPGTVVTVGDDSYTLGEFAAAGGRGVGQVLSLRLSLSEYDELSYHQVATRPPTAWRQGDRVSLSIDGIPRFLGEVVQTHCGQAEAGWAFGYSASGGKYLANLVGVKDPATGQPVMRFNIPLSEGEQVNPDYIAANAGLSVGSIVKRVLDGHAAQLAAVGIVGYVEAELSGGYLDVVPPVEVSIGGPKLMNALDGFLDEWAGTYALRIGPVYSVALDAWEWRVRLVDIRSMTPRTLVHGPGADPIGWPELVRESTDVYTRVAIIGADDVALSIRSIRDGTMAETWDSSRDPDTAEAVWTLRAYTAPEDAFDEGTVSALTSTGATFTSDRPWVVNQWGTNQATISLVNPVATGIAQEEVRRATSNAAKAAGGSATISWAGDRALENGGYTHFRMVGQARLAESDTYRRLVVRDLLTGLTGTDTYVGAHLVHRFPYGMAIGTSLTLGRIEFPTATVLYNPSHTPPWFMEPMEIEVDPVHGEVRMVKPAVTAPGLNTEADLLEGGDRVRKYDDVVCYLAYSRGPLTAAYPPDVDGVEQHGGTGYTVEHIQPRTWPVGVAEWLTVADAANMQLLAESIFRTLCDVVYSYSCEYHGKFSDALDLDMALSFAILEPPDWMPMASGWGDLHIPLREVTLAWDGPTTWRTTVSGHNRFKMATGAANFIHPSFTGGAAWDLANPFGEIRTVAETLAQLGEFGHLMEDPTYQHADHDVTDLGALAAMLGAGPTHAQMNPTFAPSPTFEGFDPGAFAVPSAAERAAFNDAMTPDATMARRRAPAELGTSPGSSRAPTSMRGPGELEPADPGALSRMEAGGAAPAGGTLPRDDRSAAEIASEARRSAFVKDLQRRKFGERGAFDPVVATPGSLSAFPGAGSISLDASALESARARERPSAREVAEAARGRAAGAKAAREARGERGAFDPVVVTPGTIGHSVRLDDDDTLAGGGG